MAENTVRLGVVMPFEMAEALRQEALRRDLSVSQIVRASLRETLRESGEEAAIKGGSD